MSEIVDQSLRKITRGALLFAVGTALGMLFSMIGRIVIVRTITQDEWGIYSLGLAIVKEIAKQHKGDSWVESSAANNTTFYVSIAKKL